MFTRCSSLALCLIAFLDYPAPAQAESSHLLEILEIRAGAVQSFQADVEYVAAAGADVKRHKDDDLKYLEFLKSHGEQVSAWNEKLARSVLVDYPPEKSFYRYYRQLPDKVRIEAFGKAEDRQQMPQVFKQASVFTGDRWQMFSPSPPREKDGVKWQNDMFVRMQPPQPQVLEIARCGAAHFDQLLAGPATNMSSFSKATLQVGWSDLFRVFAPETAVDLMEPLPNGGPPLPLLQIGDRPTEKFPLGGVRIRVWFDPADGYLPVRMECLGLADDGPMAKQRFLPNTVVEWSDPATLPNGFKFSQKAVIHVYHTLSPVVERLDQNQWPTVAYEMHQLTVTFSNIHVNEPLDPALFNIVPPSGTNVVDEISHITYIVGSSGEELRKMALDTRVDLPPTPSSNRIWMILLGVSVPLVALVVGLLFWRWRRAQLRRASK
jgi:hypothetical protein